MHRLHIIGIGLCFDVTNDALVVRLATPDRSRCASSNINTTTTLTATKATITTKATTATTITTATATKFTTISNTTVADVL